MKILHELCESHFYKEIGGKIVGERRDEVRRLRRLRRSASV
jgi:hypothetical protein